MTAKQALRGFAAVLEHRAEQERNKIVIRTLKEVAAQAIEIANRKGSPYPSFVKLLRE